MNISKLRKLKRWILAEPRRYRQDYWLFDNSSRVVAEQKPPCGTVGCLAGNACLMEGYRPHNPNAYKALSTVETADKSSIRDVKHLAAEILGLSNKQRDDLFSGSCNGWPAKAREIYRSAKTLKQQAQGAAMAIDALIAKGKKGKRTKS